MSRNSTQHVCLNGLAAMALLSVVAIRCAAAEKQLVLLINRAEIEAKTVAEAQEEANRIFRKAGIELRWVVYVPGQEGDGVVVQYDPSLLRENPLYVELVRAEPVMLDKHAMGFAVVETGGGVNAYLFCGRIEKLITNTRPPASPSQILGHVLAHEIGHLLLSHVRHTFTGVMSGRWGTKQLQQAARGELLFMPMEAARMREEVKRREAARTAKIAHRLPTEDAPQSR